MPDLQNQSPNRDTTGAADPLSNLYKMSRTAGLGSTEYVAINGAAVTAAILGMASALAMVADVLLVIPVVGVIFAIVALRQISHSNGTQGGRLLAWGGLVLSLAFAGIVIGGQVREVMAHRADSAQIVSLIDEFSAAAKAGDVDKAYDLFSPQFQQRVDKERFAGIMKMLKNHPISGELQQIKWNGVRFQFESSSDGADRIANGAMHVQFANSRDPLRTELLFRNLGQGWKIYNIPNFFPDQQQPAQRQQQQQPG
jgi:hypothetical protein